MPFQRCLNGERLSSIVSVSLWVWEACTAPACEHNSQQYRGCLAARKNSVASAFLAFVLGFDIGGSGIVRNDAENTMNLGSCLGNSASRSPLNHSLHNSLLSALLDV
eukprot:5145331-Amphidinium_carterae.2